MRISTNLGKLFIAFLLFFYFLNIGIGQANSDLDELVSAKQEFNLMEANELDLLNCANTIQEKKMRSFFKKHPSLTNYVKIISIPNCYKVPGEKYFVIVYDSKKRFEIPKYLPRAN